MGVSWSSVVVQVTRIKYEIWKEMRWESLGIVYKAE